MRDEPALREEGAPWLRRAPNWLCLRLVRGLWGLKVSGLEHLPREGPLIVAANHVALMDGPLLAMAASPARYLWFLGKEELFRVPLLGWYLRRVGAIPLNRRGDVSAMRAALEVLRRGGAFGYFPEGTRSRTGLPGKPKAGVAFLAAASGALVVPARVVNTARFPRLVPLEVRFGPGMRLAADPSDRRQCLQFAQQVMDRIFAL